jgi:hypothetical protein
MATNRRVQEYLKDIYGSLMDLLPRKVETLSRQPVLRPIFIRGTSRLGARHVNYIHRDTEERQIYKKKNEINLE